MCNSFCGNGKPFFRRKRGKTGNLDGSGHKGLADYHYDENNFLPRLVGVLMGIYQGGSRGRDQAWTHLHDCVHRNGRAAVVADPRIPARARSDEGIGFVLPGSPLAMLFVSLWGGL